MLVTIPPFHWTPLDFRSSGLPDPSGLPYRGHTGTAVCGSLSCTDGVRSARRGAARRGVADRRPAWRGIAESSMNSRESERSRRHGDLEGTGWAPRRNGAPSIPADSTRGSSSFLLLLLPSPICDHRRRHRARSSRLWRWPSSQLYDVIAGCCHRARGEMR